jgi:hypothetical protein
MRRNGVSETYMVSTVFLTFWRIGGTSSPLVEVRQAPNYVDSTYLMKLIDPPAISSLRQSVKSSNFRKDQDLCFWSK